MGFFIKTAKFDIDAFIRKSTLGLLGRIIGCFKMKASLKVDLFHFLYFHIHLHVC